MTRFGVVIAWALELLVLVALLWKQAYIHRDLFFFSESTLVPRMVFTGLFTAVCLGLSWLPARAIGFKRQEAWKLFLLSGPCIFIATMVFLQLTVFLWRGIITKEMTSGGVLLGLPGEFDEQWFRILFQRIRSEWVSFGIILVTLLTLYVKRCVELLGPVRQEPPQ